MSPRIAYWVSSFLPDMEAVASEVACLRRAFPGSITWGISPRERLRLSWNRGFGFHPRLHLAFRGATWLAQRAFDINHIFGGVGDWFHLKAVQKHPTILTIALGGAICEAGLLEKVDRFVVEWPGAKDELRQLGISPERIRLVFPPVDLTRFRPNETTPACPEDFTVVFASSPERADWLKARGVHLLLDAATILPDVRFRLIWRPWGNSLAETRRWIQQRKLANVEVVVGHFANMAEHYQRAHATVTPFTCMDRCKPVPNSLLESLACAKPVVVTSGVGLADIVNDEKLGMVCSQTAEGVAAAIASVRAEWNVLSRQARCFAERELGMDGFVKSYADLYSELRA